MLSSAQTLTVLSNTAKRHATNVVCGVQNHHHPDLKKTPFLVVVSSRAAKNNIQSYKRFITPISSKYIKMNFILKQMSNLTHSLACRSFLQLSIKRLQTPPPRESPREALLPPLLPPLLNPPPPQPPPPPRHRHGSVKITTSHTAPTRKWKHSSAQTTIWIIYVERRAIYVNIELNKTHETCNKRGH